MMVHSWVTDHCVDIAEDRKIGFTPKLLFPRSQSGKKSNYVPLCTTISVSLRSYIEKGRRGKMKRI